MTNPNPRLADDVLPDPLIKATCCHRHAAMFLDERGGGVCVYCAPRKSIFRMKPNNQERGLQELADDALLKMGVRLDGIDEPLRWDGDDS